VQPLVDKVLKKIPEHALGGVFSPANFREFKSFNGGKRITLFFVKI